MTILTGDCRPSILAPDPSGIPAELRLLPQWVVWKSDLRPSARPAGPRCR